MSGDNRLIDTNIFVYAYDVSERAKRHVARSLLDEVWDQGGGVVTLQNLSEFFVAVTKKVEHPIPASSARMILSDILRSGHWLVVNRQAQTLLTAIDLVERTGVPYWDALIAACMLEHGVTTIVTENERDFRKIPGLTVINPFKVQLKQSD
jgi:predicted nucleic acid-binding protein